MNIEVNVNISSNTNVPNDNTLSIRLVEIENILFVKQRAGRLGLGDFFFFFFFFLIVSICDRVLIQF
jgi:hypothetical protein